MRSFTCYLPVFYYDYGPLHDIVEANKPPFPCAGIVVTSGRAVPAFEDRAQHLKVGMFLPIKIISVNNISGS